MSHSRFSFLRRVRIHDGGCGAVARALHHEIEIFSLSAVDKKVLSTTNERKVMSKTTFFKRIALAAIAALGFGTLSIVPVQATVTSHTLTIDSATDAIEVGETATAVLTHQFVNLGNTFDSVTLQAVITSSNASTAGTIKMNITDSYTSLANDGSLNNSPKYLILPLDARNNGGFETDTVIRGVHAGTSGVGAGALSSTLQSTGAAVDSFTVGFTQSANRNIGTEATLRLVAPSVAGTYTVSVFTLTSTGGATAVSATPSVTWTVTVSAVTTRAGTSASTVTLRNGNQSAAGLTYFGGTAEGTDSQTLTTRVTSLTSSTPSFQLYTKLKDGTSSNAAKESYTVTVTGEAFVTSGTNGDTGDYSANGITVRPTVSGGGSNSIGSKYLRMATPVADSATIVNVWSTGTAGTATITVTTDGGVVVGTKTVTFHGPATTLTVSRTTKKVIEAGTGTSSTSAFRVTITDSGGRGVTNASGVTVVSSNVAAISGGSCSDADGTAVTDGIYNCALSPVVTSTSGMAATITVRMPDPAVTTATVAAGPWLSTTYDVTMGGAVSTFVLTTNKATYEPGEAMVVTATAKDASGNTPYDGQAGPTLRANKALGGTAAGTSITMNAYYDGVSTSQTRSTPVRTILADNTLFAPAASGAFSISGLDGQTVPVSVSVSATVSDDVATAAASAATDAALEAIDAANAATDAANLAAEAADAATVAAEEARDAADAATAAVEALATEVATLMAALKAQITTLANTVAKIAKKVKA